MRPQKKSSECFQIIAIMSACLAALSGGMLFSWTSPSIPRIVSDKETYDISQEEASFFTVLPPMGAIVSCLFSSILMDKIGRKYTLLLMGIPYITAWILIGTAKSVHAFYASRFISGLGDACLFSALPVYVGEVATPKVRGTWGNCLTFLIYLGQLFINVLGSYFSVSQTAWISILVPIVFVCSFMFMPESPYFYLMKNRVKEARVSLEKLRQTEDVGEELERIKSDVERQMSEAGTWNDLIRIESNKKALVSGVFLRASQQFAGISTFAVYGQYIFKQSGGDISASDSSLIFFSLSAGLNFCASFTLDKFGRTRSYFTSLLLCGLVLSCETIYFIIQKFYPEVNLTEVNWIPLAGMILYVFFYSFGLGIAPTLMLGELFSTSIKGKGLFVLNIVFAVLVGSITKIFYTLESNFGLYSPFLMFTVSCFVSTFLAVYLVPETKGKTLEEIQQSLKSKEDKGLSNGNGRV